MLSVAFFPQFISYGTVFVKLVIFDFGSSMLPHCYSLLGNFFPWTCIFCVLILFNDFQASGISSAPLPSDPNLDNQAAAYLLAVDNFEEAAHSALNDGLGGHSAECSLVDTFSAGTDSFVLAISGFAFSTLKRFEFIQFALFLCMQASKLLL